MNPTWSTPPFNDKFFPKSTSIQNGVAEKFTKGVLKLWVLGPQKLDQTLKL